MIIKRRQIVPNLIPHIRRRRVVLAKRMPCDFMVESMKGWEQGHKGDWLVLVGKDLWLVIADAQFTDIYEPCPPCERCPDKDPGECPPHQDGLP